MQSKVESKERQREREYQKIITDKEIKSKNKSEEEIIHDTVKIIQ